MKFFFEMEEQYIAVTRIMPLHTGMSRTVGTAISDVIDYMANPEKTDHGRLISCWNCESRVADAEFLYTKQRYEQRTGRKRGSDNVIAYHLRQSFRPGEITPEEANRLGCELVKRFTKENHAFIVCTHIDKAHIHNHIIWNSTALNETRKFRNFWGSSRAIRRLSDTICLENGYSIVENPSAKTQSYSKWLGDKKKPSHRERICYAIDNALDKKPGSFEELLRLLQEQGYQIKDGKVPSIFGRDQKRFLRMDTLGPGYTPEDLRAIISGQQQHTPRKQKTAPMPPPKSSGNLIIDIQKKLQEGKGTGYANWAKRFNIKQMAQSLLYLQEHGLTDYEELSIRTSEASSRFSQLSGEIKSAETRMAEIAVMQTQIRNYARTRKVYIDYRKAGYSKKFLSEHETDITVHKAAKKFFDEQGIQKLPSIKQLQTEYSDLLAQKKKAYAAYRQAREEMKELQIAKSNIDALLKDETAPQKESHEQEH